MSIYYPQAVVSLRVLLEDFSTKSVRLQSTYNWTVVAKEINVNLNSYLEADTFDCTIDYKNLPFDPRIIRSLAVSIHMENKKQIFDIENGKNLDSIVPSQDNIIFTGYADTDRISLDDGSRTIKIEGRDFTSLLIDREYLGDPIFLTKPVNLIIRDLLDQLPQTKVITQKDIDAINAKNKAEGKPPTTETTSLGLKIELVGVEEKDLPTLAALGPSKGALDGARNARKKRSYWDKIQELVNDSGLICFISIDKLVITRPRNLYDRTNSKVFVYGRNIKTLEFERKLGRQKGFNIRVVSLDEANKKLEDAKIPEEATDEWIKDIGISKKPITLPVAKVPDASGKESENIQPDGEVAPYLTFKVKENTNKERLIGIGEKIYEELGRQQIEGKLTTMEMKVYSKESGFFDATKFRIGTPIEIRIDHGDLEGLDRLLAPAARNKEEDQKALLNLEQRRRKIVKFLEDRGYDDKITEAMAEALTAFDTPFFTKAVTFSLSQDKGFSMDIDFINFIEIPKHLVE